MIINRKVSSGDNVSSVSLFQTTILDASKLRELADDNFKFDENGRKLSKTVRKHCEKKGEIARNEQFLLFPTVFSKDFYCRHVKTRACLGKGYTHFYDYVLNDSFL